MQVVELDFIIYFCFSRTLKLPSFIHFLPSSPCFIFSSLYKASTVCIPLPSSILFLADVVSPQDCYFCLCTLPWQFLEIHNYPVFWYISFQIFLITFSLIKESSFSRSDIFLVLSLLSLFPAPFSCFPYGLSDILLGLGPWTCLTGLECLVHTFKYFKNCTSL